MGSSATKMYTNLCKQIRLKLLTFCQLMPALYIKELMKSRTKGTSSFIYNIRKYKEIYQEKYKEIQGKGQLKIVLL